MNILKNVIGSPANNTLSKILNDIDINKKHSKTE